MRTCVRLFQMLCVQSLDTKHTRMVFERVNKQKVQSDFSVQIKATDNPMHISPLYASL